MLRQNGRCSLSLLGFLLVGMPSLHAQITTGTLTGVVKGSDGKALPQARIILTSPALFSPRVIAVNDRGEWRDPLLPPGYYKITASAPGHVGASAADVRVSLGTSLRMDLILKPVEITGTTVEVLADSGTKVDKADTKVSVNFSGDQLLSLPTPDRSFSGAIFLAPGVAEAGSGGPSVRGGMSNSTLYRVDGTDIKNDYSGNRTGTGVLEDMIEDVQVVVSPLNARLGRTTGGAVNVVTKQGGNTFTGSIRVNMDRNTWRGGKHEEWPAYAAAESDSLTKELIMTLTGPIVKDHVWFTFAT